MVSALIIHSLSCGMVLFTNTSTNLMVLIANKYFENGTCITLQVVSTVLINLIPPEAKLLSMQGKAKIAGKVRSHCLYVVLTYPGNDCVGEIPLTLRTVPTNTD